MPFVLSGHADLLGATAGHPLVRAFLRDRRRRVRGWSARGAAVWITEADHDWDADGSGEPGHAAAFGPVDETVTLLAEVAHLLPDGWDLSVPRAAADHAAVSVRLPRHVAWDLQWTTRQPAPTPGEDKVQVLDPAEYAEVDDLLDLANPTASERPGALLARLWVGVRDDTGRLIATAADASGPDIGHIASVATHPAARGRGLGAAVTVYLTRLQLAEFDLASLGFYHRNDTARRLYHRVGYRDTVEMTSGVLVRG